MQISRKTIELKICIDALGFIDSNSDMNDFKTISIVQRSVYLLQEFGLDLGYRYMWHLKGPYSSSLENIYSELICNQQLFKKLNRKAKLKENTQIIMNTCKDFVNNTKPKNKTMAEWLELVTSLHYLKKYTHRGQKAKNYQQLIELLKLEKR